MTSDELLQKKTLAIIRPIRFNYKRTTDKHEGCLRERIKPQIIYFQFDHVPPPSQVLSQETQPLSPTELQTLLNFLYAPNDELFALQVRPSHC